MKKTNFILFLLTGAMCIPAALSIGNNQSIKGTNDAWMGERGADEKFEELVDHQDKPVINSYSKLYFSNLGDRYSQNLFDSDGYIALELLLSFYDSYWNGDFVPTCYDSEGYTNLEINDLMPFEMKSPTVETGFYEWELQNVNLKEYVQRTKDNIDDDFLFYLINVGREIVPPERTNGNDPFDLSFTELYRITCEYLYNWCPFSDDEVSVRTISGTNAQIKAEIINNVTRGIPTIVMGNSLEIGNHTVVAYDYDAREDKIYVHAGLEKRQFDLNYTTLDELGFAGLTGALSLEINDLKCRPGSNYRVNNVRKNAKEFAYPRNARMLRGEAKDKGAHFVWDSLYDERGWFDAEDTFIKFEIYDKYPSRKVYENDIHGNEAYIGIDQWEDITRDLYTWFDVRLTLYVDGEINDSGIQYVETFRKPTANQKLITIDPINYKYTTAYTNVETNTFKTHTATSGETFKTRTYRTHDYIQNNSKDQFVVMSPIAKNVNKAYVEYRFDTAVSSIDATLSFWRSPSDEKIDVSKDRCYLQQFIGEKWVTVFDLFDEENNLSTDRLKAKTYTIDFNQPAYRIRFYCVSRTGVTTSSTKNLGRIAIGQIQGYLTNYNLSLSGSELDYRPYLWNRWLDDTPENYGYEVYDTTNCYSYAFNAPINPNPDWRGETMQPGESDPDFYGGLNADDVVRGVLLDAKAYGFDFIKTTREAACPAGHYKVALVMCPGTDYHWYRQNSDGTWSHKPGRSYVTDRDASNKIIMDPKECNRNGGINYYQFVGYYSVTPLNTYPQFWGM